jgi:hypothetical protein
MDNCKIERLSMEFADASKCAKTTEGSHVAGYFGTGGFTLQTRFMRLTTRGFLPNSRFSDERRRVDESIE